MLQIGSTLKLKYFCLVFNPEKFDWICNVRYDALLKLCIIFTSFSKFFYSSSGRNGHQTDETKLRWNRSVFTPSRPTVGRDHQRKPADGFPDAGQSGRTWSIQGATRWGVAAPGQRAQLDGNDPSALVSAQGSRQLQPFTGIDRLRSFPSDQRSLRRVALPVDVAPARYHHRLGTNVPYTEIFSSFLRCRFHQLTKSLARFRKILAISFRCTHSKESSKNRENFQTIFDANYNRTLKILNILISLKRSLVEAPKFEVESQQNSK